MFGKKNDLAKRFVFEQFWNVASVTDSELFPAVVNRRIFADSTFELEYDQWQTIDVQNTVRVTLNC